MRQFHGHRHFKGRGALSNITGRFQTHTHEVEDDGWYQDAERESLTEIVQADRARSVITANESPDIGFEASINPYRGCAHGCVYCFARPSHAYLGLSPGLDFETRLFYKEDAVRLLETELASPRYVCKPIALGINTDGYQPLEKRLAVTRSILEVLVRCRHPVSLITKSALILRDLDLLTDLARDGLVSVMMSVTSLCHEIKRTLEPRTASPEARLRVMRQLSTAGVPVGVMVAPVIPAITDHELEHILAAARDAGATSAGYVLLRLPHEVAPLFREWLTAHHPKRAAHVMSLMTQSHGGKDYDSTFGLRLRGTGPYAELLNSRFRLASRRLGFDFERSRHHLATNLFKPPRRATPQLALDF